MNRRRTAGFFETPGPRRYQRGARVLHGRVALLSSHKGASPVCRAVETTSCVPYAVQDDGAAEPSVYYECTVHAPRE